MDWNTFCADINAGLEMLSTVASDLEDPRMDKVVALYQEKTREMLLKDFTQLAPRAAKRILREWRIWLVEIQLLCEMIFHLSIEKEKTSGRPECRNDGSLISVTGVLIRLIDQEIERVVNTLSKEPR